MKRINKLLAVTLFFFSYSSASFSVVLNINGDTLMGASGVDVNGALYDVQFLDGTCSDLYNGCDQNTDFPFTNPNDLNDSALLNAAMTALFEQVLLGVFDTNPDLTNGCVVAGGCQINTPLFKGGSNEFIGAIGAYNSTAVEQNQAGNFDHLTAGSVYFNSNPLAHSPDTDASVFAVWTQTAVVPVPAAVWLFGSSLIGLIGMRKRQSNLQTIMPSQ